MRMRILALICVLSFCCTSLLYVPASAAGDPMNYKDYQVGDAVTNGDMRTYSVKLPVAANYTHMVADRSNDYYFTGASGIKELDGLGSTTCLWFYPFGSRIYSTGTTYSGKYLSFSNIPSGSRIEVNFTFSFFKETEDADGGYFDDDTYRYFICYTDGTYVYPSYKNATLTKIPSTEENDFSYTYQFSFSFEVLAQYAGAAFYFRTPYFDCYDNICHWEILSCDLTINVDYADAAWKDDQEIKDSLDGIQNAIEGTAAPVTPDGGSDVDDLGSAESELMDGVSGSLDNIGAAQGQASAGVSQYASGFAFLAAGVDHFATKMNWLSYLLFISLSVGSCGALLGVAFESFRGFSRSRSRGSSGGKRKGGG